MKHFALATASAALASSILVAPGTSQAAAKYEYYGTYTSYSDCRYTGQGLQSAREISRFVCRYTTGNSYALYIQ